MAMQIGDVAEVHWRWRWDNLHTVAHLQDKRPRRQAATCALARSSRAVAASAGATACAACAAPRARLALRPRQPDRAMWPALRAHPHLSCDQTSAAHTSAAESPSRSCQIYKRIGGPWWVLKGGGPSLMRHRHHRRRGTWYCAY